jgi:alkaline phosphatase
LNNREEVSVKKIWQLVLYLAITSLPAIAQTKNVILFIGDGAGVSSLNATSMDDYQRPEALYVENMPNLALADTSTARELVTDTATETLNTDIFHSMMRAFGWESSTAQVKG